jgi:hypothetical protein
MDMKMNEPLEKLLKEAGMDDYMMYTREDVIEFAKLAVEEALYVVDIPLIERNMIRQAFGMQEYPRPVRDIGLVSTTDWKK